MEIRRLRPATLPEALELVWRVFLDFEAPDYSEQGIESFRTFIQVNSIQELMNKGELEFWGAYTGEKLAGVIAVKNETHVSLLFVDPTVHRQGMATALFEEAFTVCSGSITVNSSPYALAFYRRLGFMDQTAEQTVDGIRFIPMKLER